MINVILNQRCLYFPSIKILFRFFDRKCKLCKTPLANGFKCFSFHTCITCMIKSIKVKVDQFLQDSFFLRVDLEYFQSVSLHNCMWFMFIHIWHVSFLHPHPPPPPHTHTHTHKSTKQFNFFDWTTFSGPIKWNTIILWLNKLYQHLEDYVSHNMIPNSLPNSKD